jgi:formate dehydrogenase subunit gamma
MYALLPNSPPGHLFRSHAARFPAALRPLLAAGFLAMAAVAAPVPAIAQTGDEAVGAGKDVNRPVEPGLERQTPNPGLTSPDDVQLYVPHEDQLIGRVTIPDPKLATLVQPEGRTWRAFRMEWLMWIAAIVVLGTAALLGAFYLWRGRIRLQSGWSGRWVPRFNAVERLIHWATAVSFLTLALTGLVITFGRYLLIPVIGHDAFTALAEASKYLHNFSSVPFVLGILLMLVFWIKDNIPGRDDLDWIRHGGGVLSKSSSYHPEPGRFNAGQKGIFWIVVLGGLAMALTGYLMMVPFYFTGISGMQIVHVIHSLMSAVMIAVILGHIYIGTVGMEGAFNAMGRGEVDENWAIEHHKGWYEKQRLADRAVPDDDAARQRAGAD